MKILTASFALLQKQSQTSVKEKIVPDVLISLVDKYVVDYNRFVIKYSRHEFYHQCSDT